MYGPVEDCEEGVRVTGQYLTLCRKLRALGILCPFAMTDRMNLDRL